MKYQLNTLDFPYSFNSFTPMNLLLESTSLKGNPLGDSEKRHNYILLPKKSTKPLPVIFHLSGYFSTGFQNFDVKTLKKNFVQRIDEGTSNRKIPKAIHVFVEASTWWGGSQFINSPGCGRYEDYILKELVPAVSSQFQTTDQLCVMGGSSGGYGALNLISQKNSPFTTAFATAPDSFFEASLLPELLQAAPEILKYRNLKAIKSLIEKEELQDKKSFFNLVNVLAMAHCYSPKEAFVKGDIKFPIDLYTGEIDTKLWKAWLKHDPIYFIKKRIKNLRDKQVFLDVGKYDNFSLQYGTRQIYQHLQQNKVKSELTEFPGNHFGLSERRLIFLAKLSKIWRGRG